MNNNHWLQLIGVVVLFPAFECHHNYGENLAKESRMNEYKAAMVSVTIPVLASDTLLKDVRDSFYVIGYKDYVICRFPADFIADKEYLDSAGNSMHYEIISQKSRNEYFIYRKGQSEGFYFDSLTDKSPEIKEVKETVDKNISLNCDLLLKSDDSLIEKKYFTEQSYMEKYIRPNRKEKSDFDTASFFFDSSYNEIDFTFCPELDRLKGCKLTGLVAVYKPDIYAADLYSHFLRRSELRISMVNIPEIEEIKKLINDVIKKE